jgi:hypothetical protein
MALRLTQEESGAVARKDACATQAVAGDATANIADMTIGVIADRRFRIDVTPA